MNVMINHVNICPDNDNLHADHNYSNYTGHRPKQLILELGGENKPVCWLRDISTLIVLIGSKLKYASMVQVVLFPFLSLINWITTLDNHYFSTYHWINTHFPNVMPTWLGIVLCVWNVLIKMYSLFHGFPPSSNLQLYQLSNNLHLLYLL